MPDAQPNHVGPQDRDYWRVRGGNWAFFREGERALCPIEIATVGLEAAFGISKCGGMEGWGEENESAVGQLEIDHGQGIEMGIVLVVDHSSMKSRDEHILVPSHIALVNAGLHREARLLEQLWTGLSEIDQIRSLITILEED